MGLVRSKATSDAGEIVKDITEEDKVKEGAKITEPKEAGFEGEEDVR